MTHRQFVFDEVFDSRAANSDVCAAAIEPLFQWAHSGHKATVICFGQTGTGKTFTFNAALSHIAQRSLGEKLRVTFFEIHGKNCYDLLNARSKIFLRADGNDMLHARGARTVELDRANEGQLLQVVQTALALRSSTVTERNPISSRSHAVCTIEIMVPTNASIGKITLVDLAGSERNYETTKMNAVQHRESADINYALMALKDCFRAYHQQIMVAGISDSGGEAVVRVPYRAHLLTRVLKECFSIQGESRTTIIATISPTPIDLQHSLNTVEHTVLMSPPLQELLSWVQVEVPIAGRTLSHVPIHLWTAEQVVVWLATAHKGKFAHVVLPPGLDGTGLLQLSVTGLSALFAGQLRAARGNGEEGVSWVEEAGDESKRQAAIARALWTALRFEQSSALNKAKAMTDFS
jgi:Kinesin motor domain